VNSSINSLTFQELILKLAAYYASVERSFSNPTTLKWVHGTMAPETFLRCARPNPYKVAYVQPRGVRRMGVTGRIPNRAVQALRSCR